METNNSLITRFTTSAIIFNDKGQILLLQRDEPSETHLHQKWHFPGGGVEFGEHPADTIIREVGEEVGVSAKLLSEHPFIYSQNFKELQIHAVLMAFPLLYTGGDIDTSKDPDTGDAKWFTYEEVKKLDTPPGIKELITTAWEYLHPKSSLAMKLPHKLA